MTRRSTPTAAPRGEAYIRGGGLPNPAVVTLTTGVACLAVDEFIQRLTGYRRTGSIDHRVIKHHLVQDTRPRPAATALQYLPRHLLLGYRQYNAVS